MTFLRRVPGGPERIDDRIRYQHWLDAMSGYDHAEAGDRAAGAAGAVEGRPGSQSGA